MDKVIIASVEDRLTVAAILVKNDYTVRQGKQLRQGKKSYEYYLEYAPNDKPKQAAGERGRNSASTGSREVRNARNSQPYAAM